MLGLKLTTKYNIGVTAITLLNIHIKQFSTIQVVVQFMLFSFYLAEIMCRKIHKMKSQLVSQTLILLFNLSMLGIMITLQYKAPLAVQNNSSLFVPYTFCVFLSLLIPGLLVYYYYSYQ